MLYGNADILLRLPMYGDMSCFNKIKDVPIIGRVSYKEKDEIRKKLNLPQNRQLKRSLLHQHLNIQQLLDELNQTKRSHFSSIAANVSL